MADIIRIRIEDEDDLKAARASADETGTAIQEESGPPSGLEDAIAPIAAILIGTGVAAAATFVADWWERRKGGLIIDFREGAEDDVRRDRDVPYGVILIFAAKGGEVKIETKEQPKQAMERLIEAVIGKAFDSATEIAKAAKEVLTDDDKVETKDNNGEAPAPA